LNADVGEGAPYDAEVLPLVTTANVCCGAHAGSERLSRETAQLALELGLRVAAHPGYPDRDGFGRRPMRAGEVSLESLRGQVDLIVAEGATAIKPHGAFYSQSAQELWAADLLVELLMKSRLTLIGWPVGLHSEAARRAGVRFEREGFLDRGVGEDGFLVPRGQQGAHVQPDAAAVLALAGHCDTLCAHGDGDDPIGVLSRAREALAEAGWEIGPCG
jgi:5-oxoprolinase (ATP-hydrolysing) subunit A